jgi:hypothetical protein
LKYAEQNGWQVEVGGSHAWGKFIVLTMTRIVDVEFFVYRVFEVLLKIQAIMQSRFVE